MMQRTGVWAVAVTMLLGLVLQTPSMMSRRAEAAEQAKYAGPKLCLACHSATHPDVIAAVEGSSHQRAMWRIEDQDDSHPLVGDFSAAAPFPKDKVAFVLGTGRKYQAYIDADLRVLPGEWSVKGKAWRPREAVDATLECLGCHTTGFNPETKQWAALGVTCEMCHGPGSTHVGSKDKLGTVVRPASLDPAERAMICGQCHAAGKARDSAHTFPVGYHPGDDLGQYFVLAEEVGKGVVNSQYNEFVKSTHLAGGTVCTSCHSAHGSVGDLPSQLKAATNDLCLECHSGKLAGPQHEPSALQAVTCSMCHMPGGKHTFAAPGE